MAGTLGDRHYQSYRLVQPGRRVLVAHPLEYTDKRGGDQAEEYAIAVVGPDGGGIEVMSLAELMGELIYELRALRVAMMLQGTAADLHDGVENTVQ